MRQFFPFSISVVDEPLVFKDFDDTLGSTSAENWLVQELVHVLCLVFFNQVIFNFIFGFRNDKTRILASVRLHLAGVKFMSINFLGCIF